MRSWIVILLVMICALTVPMVEGSTFHFDDQRTGNFSDEGPKLPGILWKANLTALIGSSPVYHDGVVYATNWYGWGSWEPGLYAINASDGKIMWRNENVTGASTIAISNNRLFVGNLTGQLYCINLTTGEEVWSKKLEKYPAWHGIASSPLIYNDTVYITTFSNGTLYALNFTGNELWNFTTGEKVSHYTSPSAHNGKIFFAGNKSEKPALYCLNDSGSELWNYTVESSITNTPAVKNEKVFFATENRFYAVDSDGTELWNITFNGSMSTAALAYGNIYIGSKEGVLYCMNQSTGNVIWSFTANGEIDSSPAVTSKTVYFGTNTPNGTVYALNTFNGNLLWDYSLNPPQGEYYNIMSSPYVVGNKLFTGSDDGNVYCFGDLWKGEVELNPARDIIELKNGNYTQINGTSALAALQRTNLNISVVNSGGKLYVESIAGIGAESSNNWSYWVNYPQGSDLSVGANNYVVKDRDTVYWYYSENESVTPENSSFVLEIETRVEEVAITSFSVSNSSKGGNATAWLNLTTLEKGWYVAVVSGTNNGESVAGISTFYAKAYDLLKVPVLISIPQQVPTGTYQLYAGIYKLNNYPNNILDWYGHRTCEVK